MITISFNTSNKGRLERLKMRFSEELQIEAKPMWDAIYAHPFLREIKDGTLPLDTFKYYLAQDYYIWKVLLEA